MSRIKLLYAVTSMTGQSVKREEYIYIFFSVWVWGSSTMFISLFWCLPLYKHQSPASVHWFSSNPNPLKMVVISFCPPSGIIWKTLWLFLMELRFWTDLQISCFGPQTEDCAGLFHLFLAKSLIIKSMCKILKSGIIHDMSSLIPRTVNQVLCELLLRSTCYLPERSHLILCSCLGHTLGL